jgi:hypothetical protein
MKITINGKVAAIKSGSSFEYVSENRLFTGSDGYTLSIDFPLKDCAQNQAIFGLINRRDIALGTLRFNCEISDKNVFLSGTLTITKLTETVVTGQFLEGRSAQNFDDTFDDIYINELDLGLPDDMSTDVSPETAWHLGGNPDLLPVALPWVNDSNDGATNNFATYDEKQGCYVWDEDTIDTGGLSYFPYLLPLVKSICKCKEVGYDCDFSVWENSQWRYLLCCNALPYAWEIYGYARALPHWTMTELFENLEFLLGCEFEINHRAQSIEMTFTSDVLKAKSITRIENVVDSFSTEVSADEHSSDYVACKNYKFKEPGEDWWGYQDCNWFIEDVKYAQGDYKEFATFNEVWDAAQESKTYKVPFTERKINHSIGTVYYAADIDMYFMHKVDRKQYVRASKGDTCNWCQYTTHLIAINTFGERVVDDSDDADEQELELMPVRIDDTDDDHGLAMFLSPSSYSEAYDDSTDSDKIEDWDDLPFSQSHNYQALGNGDIDEAEYYSSICVGFYNGDLSFPKLSPTPHVAPVELTENWQFARTNWSMQLARPDTLLAQDYPKIDPKIKYTFSFLADNIPDVRGVFLIGGKKYVCAKVTATFSETGMSELLKGEFYPVTEDEN